MSNGKEAEMQETINALNARTAANDVEIQRLKDKLDTQAQQVDVLVQQRTTLLTEDRDRMLELYKANEAIIAALKAQSPEAVKLALLEHDELLAENQQVAMTARLVQCKQVVEDARKKLKG